MSATVEIRGYREIDHLLATLPNALSRKLMFSALRKSGNILVKAARAILKAKTKGKGLLARSIGMVTDTFSTYPAVWIGPRHLAGRGAHSLKNSPLALKKTKSRIASALKGGFQGWRAHFIEFGTVKQPAKPFMRPAYDQNKDRIIDSIAGNFGDAVHKYMEKNKPRI